MIAIRSLASSSRANAYTIDDGVTRLLLEAGLRLPELRRRLEYSLSGISGAIISHEHRDHARGVNALAWQAAMDVYMSRGTAEALGVAGHYRVHRLGHRLQPAVIGSWSVMALPAIHDAAEPLTFLLASDAGRLLFATDTARMPVMAPDLTHLMAECNYCPEIVRERLDRGEMSRMQKYRLEDSHQSTDTLCEWLAQQDTARLCEIWLLHVSRSNGNPTEMRRRVMELVPGAVVRIA